jgi:hypothetical protein
LKNLAEVSVQEEILTFKEACSFLKISHSIGYAWIKAYRLRASRTGIGKKKGDYRILKSDCIAAITVWHDNKPLNSVQQYQEVPLLQSKKSVGRGTQMSLSQVSKDLDLLLRQRTTNKLRRSKID